MRKPEKYRDGYRIRWKDHEGKERCKTFKAYRDAERAQTAAIAEVDAILAGRKGTPPAERKFGQLCDYWLANHAIHKRSMKDDESVIRRHLRPGLGDVSLSELGAVHIDALRLRFDGLAPKTINNILTLLGTMLRLALELEWMLKIPRIKKPKAAYDAEDDRFLRTDEEVHRFLISAREQGDDAWALYSTAVYTGMRLGELAALRWGDIRFPARLIMVQRSHDDLTKSGKARAVPILDPLLPILREWRTRNPSDLVFPNEAGVQYDRSARIFQERLHRTLDAAGFERPKTGRYKHIINFHSLRHTFASHWAMNGGNMWKLRKVLGHQSIEMTMRYSHLQPEAFGEDYERLSGLACTGAPVIRLKHAS